MKSGIIVTVVASFYLVGLSVTVALVVYPSFGIVDESRCTAFRRHRIARITWALGGSNFGLGAVARTRTPRDCDDVVATAAVTERLSLA